MWPNPSFLRIWSHLLEKFLMENFIFFAMCRKSWDNLERVERDDLNQAINVTEVLFL